jgi:hypothetical protein
VLVREGHDDLAREVLGQRPLRLHAALALNPIRTAA